MLMDIKELHRSEKSVVTLVIDPDTGTRYVRTQLQGSHPVYAQLQAISHPYLPNIIQLEQQADGVTLLEEYIDGASLAEITLPEKQVIAVFCQVKIPGFAKANSLVLPREFPGNCQINSLVLPRYFTRMRALRRR